MADGERVYFDRDGVTVTSARFIVPGQTYAMSGITSVKGGSESKLLGAILLGLLGLGVFGTEVPWVGIIVIAFAVFWYMQSKHTVLLTTASGESKALASRDKKMIEEILSALNDAIIGRG